MDKLLLYNILVVFGSCVISIIIEMMLLPRIIYIAKKKKLFDIPDSRKTHNAPIPRLGGITFVPTILLVGLLGLFVRLKFDTSDFDVLVDRMPEVILLICGLIIIFMLGFKDDLVGVSFKKKFIIQFLASLCIVSSGVYFNNLYGLFGFYEIPDSAGVVVSIIFIMFTTNAINLIDGTDGLASGISVVAALTYGVIFGIFDMWLYASFAFITIGVLIPFFYYNFFHPSRKIFMGDTGSLTLGFLLAFMALKSSMFPPENQIVPSGLILLVLSALFIPLFDALKVMIVRISMGRGPFSPDRNHIHHKLMDLGLSKKRTVLVILLSSLILIVLTWVLLYLNVNPTIVFVVDMGIGVVANIILYRAIRIRISKGLLLLDSKVK